MSDSSFLDTNVVVYAFDDDEPTKQHRAREILEAPANTTLVVSTQVLAEFYVTVTRKLHRPLGPTVAASAVETLAELPIVDIHVDLVLDAIALARSHQLSLWDAQIVQAAKVSGCERVLTEDLADGSRIGGVRIENPFTRSTAP